MPHHQRQLGSTLTGFIAGLLVGLGIALAVAVYISKVPIPLVDRGVQRQPDQDAIDRERSRDWNPNASLGGGVRSPAQATTTAPASPAAAPATPDSAPTTANDPLGALIQSRTTSPGQVTTVEAPPLVDPFVYFVQAGAFRGQTEAEAQRARLAMLGFQAEVSEREQAGRPVFRVRLGPFASKVDADIMQERLTGQGVEANLVRVQR